MTSATRRRARRSLRTLLQIDPRYPVAWNNLANYDGENGPLTNAFADYARAIELDPTEPVYYRNLATTVYLYRKDARSFYGINEQQVFDKALDLYRKAVQLDPDNFAARGGLRGKATTASGCCDE